MVREHKGFSLIELLISLAILAAVTTIAIRATSGLQSQAQYQATTRSLTDIQSAIVGSGSTRGADGSTMVSGFVADTGRLPYFLINVNDPLGAAAGDPLNELLQQNAIPAFSFYSANSDPSVLIGVGWKGPYIRLAAGPTYIRDGWGNSFHTYDALGNLLTAASPPNSAISQISSWAADKTPDTFHGGTGDTSGYNADVSVPYPNSLLLGGFQTTGILYGSVTMNNGTDTVAGSPLATGPVPNITYTPPAGTQKQVGIWVVYFGPDLTQAPHPVGEVLGATPILPPPTSTSLVSPFTYVVSTVTPGTPVTIGPRVIKAYVIDTTVGDVGALTPSATLAAVKTAIATTPNALTGPVFFSATLNVTVTGGGQTLSNIVLPHYSP